MSKAKMPALGRGAVVIFGVLACLAFPSAARAEKDDKAKAASQPAASQPTSAPASQPAPKGPKGCLKCHGDPKLNAKLVSGKRELVLDMKALAKSVHASNDCTDCHTQLEDADAEAMHKKKIGPPLGCQNCHEKAYKVYMGSVHGEALKKHKKGMAMCGDCHGAHDIVKIKSPKSRVFKTNLPLTCAKCHRDANLAKQAGIHDPKAAEHYIDSIHGRGLLVAGLIVSASCTDCHGAHDIYPKKDKRSTIHHDNVPKTCAKCHLGIIKVYEKSVHGQLLAKGKKRGPVCVDCHTSHEIGKPTTNVFKLHSDESCGKCHQDRLKRYRETYHGKAIALGKSEVAACFDCHGHHDVLPHTNPKSHLSAQNKLKTCQRCHPDATKNFADYLAHGDHTDKKNYPQLYWMFIAMTGLLISVFAFFALHTLLWLVRSVVLFMRDPEVFREQKRLSRQITSGKVYIRFRPVDRFCHLLVIISFLLLTLTGMPLKFYDTWWAQWMFGWMGGADVAATLHRLGAYITVLYFAVHIVSVFNLMWRNRPLYRNEKGRFKLRLFLKQLFGPDSPMPNMQDLRDFVAHNKWFFGKGPKPQFDRWTYWEKFDYLAVFWGVAVIGLSGLVMWIPEQATKILPGWIINVSHIMHSDEALLAAGFIFTFHFFNVHFRVEKFPMDPVIFSGRITEDEMIHERKRLYDRLKAEGRLEQSELKDEWKHWKRIFQPFGMIAFTIGVILIVAIYWAMATRMLGG